MRTLFQAIRFGLRFLHRFIIYQRDILILGVWILSVTNEYSIYLDMYSLSYVGNILMLWDLVLFWYRIILVVIESCCQNHSYIRNMLVKFNSEYLYGNVDVNSSEVIYNAQYLACVVVLHFSCIFLFTLGQHWIVVRWSMST